MVPDERACQASGYSPLVVVLTVPKGSRWPYASNTAIYGRIWLKTPRSRKNGVQASILFAKVDGTVLPEPPMEEGLAHCRSERS